ncbi:tyrosine-type recombinase/integrase [Tabrizicola sp. M-4]|uniref:tyrosine-type recombinase/integrase n=1 Tax=Tabrizicola sp. M-4 TaxID=3055847 RepID=UPI003DA91324
MTLPKHPSAPPALSRLTGADEAALEDLFRRGTPDNTRRAYETDLSYIAAWKRLSFGGTLDWPEHQDVALRFVLDHSRDLGNVSANDPSRQVAEALIAFGLRRSLDCPAPATLDRRIATWRALHRMRDLSSPFDAPLIKQARAKARKAAARPPAPKSQNPVTRDVLKALLDATGPGLRGLRDRAILLLGWSSGGRRRSEIVSFNVEDVDLTELDARGIVWLRLIATKTTAKGKTPRLVLKGAAARAVVAWLDATDLKSGPLFRKITAQETLSQRRLTADAVAQILRRLIATAGLPEGFATPHGLRSGFLTQAALDGAPLQAAMRLSLHKSAAQAQKYYTDVDVADNPAADLFDRQ